MWRRVSSHLRTLARSALHLPRSNGRDFLPICAIASAPSSFQKTTPLFSDFDGVISQEKKRVEDVMPIATGHEREELEAELEGRKRFDMDVPVGPFGTKRMSMMLYGFGWRKARRMSVPCILNISCWKCLVKVDRLMDMVMMITDAGDANLSFQNKYWV